MDLAFDPAEHKEFAEYIIANQKNFDKIEAQYMATKDSKDQSGIYCTFTLLFLSKFILTAMCDGHKPEADMDTGLDNREDCGGNNRRCQ